MLISANPTPLIPLTINGFTENGDNIPLVIGNNPIPQGKTIAKVVLESASYNGIIYIDGTPYSVRLAGKLSIYLTANLLSNLFTFKWRTSLKLKFKLHLVNENGVESQEFIMPKSGSHVDIAVANMSKLESVEITLLDKSVANTLIEVYGEFAKIKEKFDSFSVSLVNNFAQSYKLPYYLIGKKLSTMSVRDNIDEIALMASGTIPFSSGNTISIIAKSYKLTTTDIESYLSQVNPVTVEQLKSKALNDNEATNLVILLNIAKGVWML